jgi:hypothetical protein
MAGRGHPELLTRCHNLPPAVPLPPPNFLVGKVPSEVAKLPALGPMDPTKNSMWELLHTLFEELTTVFPDAFMHLGGDEVRPNPNPYPNRSG